LSRVLLVEDEQLLADSYQIILRSEGYKVDWANNGKIGLTYYRQNKYNIVLLDIMMPVMDGIGFLKRLRAIEPDQVKARIIVLSNLSSDSKINEALMLGADSYIQKSELEPAQLIGQ